MIRSKQKIRLKFIKGEEIRYISHLDMVRVFTRAIRRARLPIATTCGFVPREKISFSSPLSLGLISKSEYVDLEFSDFINPEKLKVRLNKELPSGLRVEETETIPLKSKSLMVIFDCAEYEVKLSDLRYQMADIKESIKKFLAQREIIIKRETKKGVKVINIRPLILNLELKESFIKMLLKIKVRPQEVVKALLNLSREETLGLIIERKDLLKI